MSSEYSHMKVAELKKELKSRGLSTSGNKDELISRLTSNKKASLSPSSDIGSYNDNTIEGSDILDEEDVLEGELDLVDEDKLLKKTPEHQSEMPDVPDVPDAPSAPTTCVEHETKPPDEVSAPKPEAKKKIVLIRKSSVPILGGDDTEEKTEGEAESKPKENGDADNSDSKEDRLKMLSLSMEERKILRAKKFGITNAEEKIAARAARFGIPYTPSSASSSIDEPLDVLKKRAERFGTVTSTSLSKEMYEEKVRARKARFGISQLQDDDTEERKRKRLERFKK